MAFKRFMFMAVFIWFLIPNLSFAHEPIFMISPEAPGKGAFDLHTSIQSVKRGNEREFELEQEFTYGLSRSLAVGLSVPFAREEEFTSQGQNVENGLKDPSVMFKWRFWDKDLPGVKYSAATLLQTTIPVGRGEGRLGRDKPSILAGLAHGREGLYWYYIVDFRYQYHVEDNNTKPGDGLHFDAAYGLRPVLRGLEETDIVFFFELNYLHEYKAQKSGLDDPNSGGDFVFFSPEILISPTNRIMLRGGVQIPIIQDLNGTQDPKDYTFKLVAEFRF